MYQNRYLFCEPKIVQTESEQGNAKFRSIAFDIAAVLSSGGVAGVPPSCKARLVVTVKVIDSPVVVGLSIFPQNQTCSKTQSIR
jgi:hypothetical protein